MNRSGKHSKLIVKKKRLRRLDAVNLAEARGGTAYGDDSLINIVTDGCQLDSILNGGKSMDPKSLVPSAGRRNHNQLLRL